jgi:hypothetical protein
MVCETTAGAYITRTVIKTNSSMLFVVYERQFAYSRDIVLFCQLHVDVIPATIATCYTGVQEVGPAFYEYSARVQAGGAGYWRRVLVRVELRTLPCSCRCDKHLTTRYNH